MNSFGTQSSDVLMGQPRSAVQNARWLEEPTPSRGWIEAQSQIDKGSGLIVTSWTEYIAEEKISRRQRAREGTRKIEMQLHLLNVGVKP